VAVCIPHAFTVPTVSKPRNSATSCSGARTEHGAFAGAVGSSMPIAIPQKSISSGGALTTSETVRWETDHASLRATRQALGSQQQHDGLQIHAEVGPLGGAHLPLDAAEHLQAPGRLGPGLDPGGNEPGCELSLRLRKRTVARKKSAHAEPIPLRADCPLSGALPRPRAAASWPACRGFGRRLLSRGGFPARAGHARGRVPWGARVPVRRGRSC
jgi:hypothetical protein